MKVYVTTFKITEKMCTGPKYKWFVKGTTLNNSKVIGQGKELNK